MNVLMLSTVFPCPATHGGALRVWNILKQVGKRHAVTFLTMYLRREKPSPEHLEQVRPCVKEIHLVERPAGFARRITKGVWSLAGGRPYTLANFYFAAFAQRIRQLQSDRSFDLVHAHYLHTAQYYPFFDGLCSYFDCQNVNAILWRRFAEVQGRNVLSKWFALRQASLLDRMERHIHRSFDATTFCSEYERAYARTRAPEAALFTVPNGVDCNLFQPAALPEEPCSLVFTGSMNARQNIDAAVFFVRTIFPIICRERADVRLYLVGQKPGRVVRALASERVVVTGTVEDVRPYIGRATVYIVPIRIGGGTRLKILEAMAMGKAIVATSVGAEGIEYASGDNIVIADPPAAFARSVLDLVNDSPRRRQLGAAARQLVLEKYEWDAIGKKVESCYELARARFGERQIRGR